MVTCTRNPSLDQRQPSCMRPCVKEGGGKHRRRERKKRKNDSTQIAQYRRRNYFRKSMGEPSGGGACL